MELHAAVVIEIRVDDGIMGESPLHTGIGCHSDFIPASKCAILSLTLSGCSSPPLHSDIMTIAHLFIPFITPALFLFFCFFFSSMILSAIFPSATFSCLETPPSCRAGCYCSNCFLRLHWPNKRKLSLMLIAHKRRRAFPSRNPTSDYFVGDRNASPPWALKIKQEEDVFLLLNTDDHCTLFIIYSGLNFNIFLILCSDTLIK